MERGKNGIFRFGKQTAALVLEGDVLLHKLLKLRLALFKYRRREILHAVEKLLVFGIKLVLHAFQLCCILLTQVV